MSSKQLLWGEKPSAMFKRGSTGSPRLTIIYSATTRNYDSDGQGDLLPVPEVAGVIASLLCDVIIIQMLGNWLAIMMVAVYYRHVISICHLACWVPTSKLMGKLARSRKLLLLYSTPPQEEHPSGMGILYSMVPVHGTCLHSVVLTYSTHPSVAIT